MKKKDDSRQHLILPSESVEHLSGRLFWDDEVVVFAAVVGFCGDSFYGMNFWTRMMTVKTMMMMMEMMLAEKSNGRRRREKQMIRLI